MAEPLRHRQTKGAVTDMFYLTPPRHISTLHKASVCAVQGHVRCFGQSGLPDCPPGASKAARHILEWLSYNADEFGCYCAVYFYLYGRLQQSLAANLLVDNFGDLRRAIVPWILSPQPDGRRFPNLRPTRPTISKNAPATIIQWGYCRSCRMSVVVR